MSRVDCAVKLLTAVIHLLAALKECKGLLDVELIELREELIELREELELIVDTAVPRDFDARDD